MKKLLITLIIIVCSFSSKAQDAQIIGNWQLTTVVANGETETGLKAVFIFEDNGMLKAARNADSKTMDAGTWKYNKKKKTIVMTSGLDKDFNGEASVVRLNNKELVYKKDGATLSFIKLGNLSSPPKIEMVKPILSFVVEDFLGDDDGYYEEPEAEKLPWKITDVVNNLKEIKEVVFQVVGFPDSRAADTWVISTKINYNEEEQTMDARQYSYFQNDYIDMTEDPIAISVFEEYNEDFRFFPEEDLDMYKVVATNETIETALGSLECTVVEGFDMFNNKVQYWMVNNQPGVFAKTVVVRDEEPPFGKTNVNTLKEIK